MYPEVPGVDSIAYKGVHATRFMLFPLVVYLLYKSNKGGVVGEPTTAAAVW